MYRQMLKAFECARESYGDGDSVISISDIVAAAKANVLECNKKMGERETCDPLKEYLGRAREVHSKVHSLLTGYLLLKKKTLIGNFGLTLSSVIRWHTCLCSC